MATAIITVSYIIVPIIFNLLVRLEQYRPTVVINITMIRYLTWHCWLSNFEKNERVIPVSFGLMKDGLFSRKENEDLSLKCH